MRKIWKGMVLGAVLLFLYLPILVLAVYSFTDAANIGAVRGFSVKNYVTLFTTPELVRMIMGTAALAFSAAAIATVLGTLGAVGSFYSKKGMSSAITTMNQIPVVNADVVTGFSICILLVVVLGISKDTFIPLVAGHVTLCAPFVFLSVIPKLKQMDSSIYEAALDLGASHIRAFFKVVFPDILPGVLSGFLMAFTMSLDDFIITHFTKGPGVDTLSTKIYTEVKKGIKPEMYSLSTLIFVTVLLLLFLVNKTPAEQKKKKLQMQQQGGKL